LDRKFFYRRRIGTDFVEFWIQRTISTFAMPKTRSKGAPAAASSVPASTSSRYSLAAEKERPPNVFILPRKATAEAKVVSLPNPRYSKPTRYLVCPEAGIFEFTRISAPKTAPRSWLIEGSSQLGSQDGERFQAQVSKSADLYVASPVDPLFLVLPALATQSSKSDGAKRMYLSGDDHLDALSREASHLSEILRWTKTRQLVESRMAAVCDTVEAGDESMFRLNEDKLVKEILTKAQRMSANGLPKSMGEKFVTKALEAPVLSQRSTAGKSQTTDSNDTSSEAGASTPQTDSVDSQASTSTVDTAASFVSEASTAATSVADDSAPRNGEVTTAIQAPAEIVKLQALRVAFNFICSSYIPPALAENLKKRLATQKTVDFSALDDYTTQLAKLRQEATLLRAASDFSRKRGRDEEDDERAEKKRKKDEEEQRKKANQSRGVRDLKKVNVSGMKKMSDFFKKKA